MMGIVTSFHRALERKSLEPSKRVEATSVVLA